MLLTIVNHTSLRSPWVNWHLHSSLVPWYKKLIVLGVFLIIVPNTLVSPPKTKSGSPSPKLMLSRANVGEAGTTSVGGV
jgi:hypothetical protein